VPEVLPLLELDGLRLRHGEIVASQLLGGLGRVDPGQLEENVSLVETVRLELVLRSAVVQKEVLRPLESLGVVGDDEALQLAAHAEAPQHARHHKKLTLPLGIDP